MSKIPINLPNTGGIKVAVDDKTSELYYTTHQNEYHPVVINRSNVTVTEIVDYDSTSAYIPVLSGATIYNFIRPISALTIDKIPYDLHEAVIICKFDL